MLGHIGTLYIYTYEMVTMLVSGWLVSAEKSFIEHWSFDWMFVILIIWVFSV